MIKKTMIKETADEKATVAIEALIAKKVISAEVIGQQLQHNVWNKLQTQIKMEGSENKGKVAEYHRENYQKRNVEY